MILYLITSNTVKWYARFGAWLIRAVERTNFSHASIACRIHDEVMVAEAVFPKTRFVNYSFWIKGYRVDRVFRIKLDEQSAASVIAYAARHDTKPYSVLQLINIAIKRVLPFFARGLNSESALICSEFAARALQKGLAQSMPHIDDFDSVGLKELQAIIDTMLLTGLAEEVSYSELEGGYPW